MKQINFVFDTITISCNIQGYCFIYKNSIAIWVGTKDELIKFLKSINA